MRPRAPARELALAAVALLAVVVTNLLDVRASSYSFAVGLLDANWEFSWSHDADMLVLAAGVVAAVRGGRHARNKRRLWYGTAALLCLFLLDEASPLHARVDDLAAGKLLYTPLLLVLVACIWALAAATDERLLVGAGLLTLFVSFAMHVAGLHFLETVGYWTRGYQAGVGFKEGTELAGLLLVVLGLWRLARPVRPSPATAPGPAGRPRPR